MTALVRWLKEDVGKLFSDVSTEALKAYKDMVDAFKLEIWEGFVEWWKKLETHFQVDLVRLAVSTGDELQRRSSDVQSSSGKSSTLFSSRVAKALNMGRSCNKSSSVDRMKAREPHEGWGSKGAKKPGEGPLSSNNNIDVDFI